MQPIAGIHPVREALRAGRALERVHVLRARQRTAAGDYRTVPRAAHSGPVENKESLTAW